MAEKELAVRLYKAWYGIEEFNGEAAKLKPHWLRGAAEAARIAKEARVEALREVHEIAKNKYREWLNGSARTLFGQGYQNGCVSIENAIQALIDAETAQKGE